MAAQFQRRALAEAPPLGFGTRAAFGAGAMANGVKGAAFTTYLMFYYNQVVGVPAAIVSLAIGLTLVVDALADPFLGRWSDVTRSRWGRRHPFMYSGILPTALFFILTWFAPKDLGNFGVGVWIFVTASLARVSISGFEIASTAMVPELVDDYRERTRLFSLRYWFGYVGTFGFTAFSLTVFFASTPEYPRGQLNPAGYPGFVFAGAAVIAAAILICALGTHNRIPWLRQAETRTGATSVKTHIHEMLAAFSNRGFLAILGFGVFKFAAVGLVTSMSLYMGTYLWKLTGSQLALLTFDSVVAATLAVPLAPIMSNRLGKKLSAMIFGVLGVSIGQSIYMLGMLGIVFVPGSKALVPLLFVVGAIAAGMVAISFINTTSMLADVVEDSAVQTGRFEAGTFFAASSFMQQCSSALGIVFTGLVLTWAKFPEKPAPGQVTREMVDSLVLHVAPTVLGLWVIGASILSFYPISKTRHLANLATLRSRDEADRRIVDAPALPGDSPAEGGNPALDGSYDCVLETPRGDQKTVFTVRTNGNAFTGQNAGEFAVLEVENGEVDGNKLYWNMSVQSPVQLSFDCQAEIVGDVLTGKFIGKLGSMAFKGIRQK